MKVFVLWRFDEGSHPIMGVFSSRELAMKQYRKYPDHIQGDLSIDCAEIDSEDKPEPAF
jgi:hypothetical protein